MADPATLPPPSLRLAFDGDALAANWRAMNRLSGGGNTEAPRAGAAVKADGYGTGIARAMAPLVAAGCRDFFVAHWSEVPALLAHVPGQRVSVLHGPVTGADARFAREIGVKPVINSVPQAQLWAEAGGGLCDLMVDTGMNRLGIRPDELGDPAIAMLDVDLLMSHLACADEDSAMNPAQARDFAALLGRKAHRRASIANSAGIALGPAFRFDLTRPGLALYGGIPRSELAHEVQQVIAPEAALIQLRDVPAGETVGYGATFTAPRRMRVGIVSLGYADGFLRAWAGSAGFTAGDEPTVLPALGRISMDMTAIDCTALPHLREGDWVRAQYDLAKAAQSTGLSQYELLTLAGPRLRG